MAGAIAYLLTWTCYGTWVPGDERGSYAWSRAGGRYIEPNEKQAEHWRHQLGHDPATLNEAARPCAEIAIRDACEYRGWELHALNVRLNHVHVVVRADVPPEQVMQRLKARATRLLRERGFIEEDRPVWTRHGSTRPVWDGDELRRAIDYVLNRQ